MILNIGTYTLKDKFYSNFFYTFEVKLEDTSTRYEKYPSKLDISRSFIRIFELKLEDTSTRCEKYPSKLDISRSFIRIFEGIKRNRRISI